MKPHPLLIDRVVRAYGKIHPLFGRLPPLLNETGVTTFGKQYPQLTESAVTERLKKHLLLKSQ